MRKRRKKIDMNKPPSDLEIQYLATFAKALSASAIKEIWRQMKTAAILI